MGTRRALNVRRRTLLGAAAALAVGACARRETEPAFDGGWVGAAHERGHRLRGTKSGAWPAPSVSRCCSVAIVGGGIAGLAAARALLRAGVDDVVLFELEDAAGGNSRGHRMADVECPLGAHYLPLPGPHAHEVAQWLDELGLRRVEHGRVVYDERHLCHSPQERLWIDGQWIDGLLPPAPTGSATHEQYRGFARQVDTAQRELGFALPTMRAPWTLAHSALDAQTFAQWLDAQRFDDPRLRWYLDYCCRDDYGAGISTVSAWAGLHYFASRHGFRVSGSDPDGENDAVLTWPEGNAWLVRRLAAPLGERLRAGHLVLRVDEGRHGVGLDVWNESEQHVEHWTARHLVSAVPLFVAARLLQAPPPALHETAAAITHAPWLVANLQLATPLTDKPGAAPSWDNVLYDDAALGQPPLGYVDAAHQSLRPQQGATVLTAYWALGGASPAELIANRRRLLDDPWRVWAGRVIDDLARAHPDLPRKLKRVDLMRYGHAMAIPRPGVRASPALAMLRQASAGRVRFAHADLAGYSVLEEAFTLGDAAGRAVAAAFTNASVPRSHRPAPARRG